MTPGQQQNEHGLVYLFERTSYRLGGLFSLAKSIFLVDETLIELSLCLLKLCRCWKYDYSAAYVNDIYTFHDEINLQMLKMR